jgi:hypothetical protein
LRKLLTALTVIGAAVLVASPVGAKGIDHAHFSGPGLPPEGVTIIRGSYKQLVKTGLLKPKRRALSAFGLSRPDLGPAYRAEYRMDYAPRVALHQIIYPYAKNGPVTFMRRGQHIGQDFESFRGGWYAAPSSLLTFLVVNGFPRHNPAVAAQRPISADEGTTSTAQPPSRPWPWVVAAALAIACISVLIVRGRRRTINAKSQ